MFMGYGVTGLGTGVQSIWESRGTLWDGIRRSSFSIVSMGYGLKWVMIGRHDEFSTIPVLNG